jgi:4-amino-4-deoxy-L-arabinose transferase-like glycosyltransferase
LRDLVRRHFRFFWLVGLAAIALRLLFLFFFPAVTSDSFVYGDIAKNWLAHGIYGLSGPEAISPTYIRLPGYPAFLAAVFATFGMEHYRAALVLQILVDLGTCFLTADLARRLFSPTAAKTAYLLAALCPFLANYAAAALTETWEIFFTALAFDCALVAFAGWQKGKLGPWIGCGLAVASTILLRPDGGLLLVALLLYWAGMLVVRLRAKNSYRQLLAGGLVLATAALAPLLPWGLRNWHTLHRFEALAPRYANDADEFVPQGFNLWVKTWMADYASVEEIYWPVPGDRLEADKLPARAFDSSGERGETEKLLADYNQTLAVTPDLDARFARLAKERIARNRLRYYFWLPALRIFDMWLRPRTELLPADRRWWEFNDDPKGSAWAVGLGLLNLLYLTAAVVGGSRARFRPEFRLLIAFLILRSVFLATLENPEPRYTLEMYPVIIVFAAACWAKRFPPLEAATVR